MAGAIAVGHFIKFLFFFTRFFILGPPTASKFRSFPKWPALYTFSALWV